MNSFRSGPSCETPNTGLLATQHTSEMCFALYFDDNTDVVYIRFDIQISISFESVSLLYVNHTCDLSWVVIINVLYTNNVQNYKYQ